MLGSMYRGAAVLAVAFVLASPLAAEAKGKVYGNGVKVRVATSVDKLLAGPSQWVGKTVRVDGVVTDVCSKAGCWLEMSDQKTGKSMRFKVDDGVIVFPVSARGHKASAEGTFEELVLSPREQKEHSKEYSKEHSADAAHADHASPAKGPSYQIRATGAVIY